MSKIEEFKTGVQFKIDVYIGETFTCTKTAREQVFYMRGSEENWAHVQRCEILPNAPLKVGDIVRRGPSKVSDIPTGARGVVVAVRNHTLEVEYEGDLKTKGIQNYSISNAFKFLERVELSFKVGDRVQYAGTRINTGTVVAILQGLVRVKWDVGAVIDELANTLVSIKLDQDTMTNTVYVEREGDRAYVHRVKSYADKRGGTVKQALERIGLNVPDRVIILSKSGLVSHGIHNTFSLLVSEDTIIIPAEPQINVQLAVTPGQAFSKTLKKGDSLSSLLCACGMGKVPVVDMKITNRSRIVTLSHTLEDGETYLVTMKQKVDPPFMPGDKVCMAGATTHCYKGEVVRRWFSDYTLPEGSYVIRWRKEDGMHETKIQQQDQLRAPYSSELVNWDTQPTIKFKVGDKFFHKTEPKHRGTITQILDGRYYVNWSGGAENSNHLFAAADHWVVDTTKPSRFKAGDKVVMMGIPTTILGTVEDPTVGYENRILVAWNGNPNKSSPVESDLRLATEVELRSYKPSKFKIGDRVQLKGHDTIVGRFAVAGADADAEVKVEWDSSKGTFCPAYESCLEPEIKEKKGAVLSAVTGKKEMPMANPLCDYSEIKKVSDKKEAKPVETIQPIGLAGPGIRTFLDNTGQWIKCQDPTCCKWAELQNGRFTASPVYMCLDHMNDYMDNKFKKAHKSRIRGIVERTIIAAGVVGLIWGCLHLKQVGYKFQEQTDALEQFYFSK